MIESCAKHMLELFTRTQTCYIFLSAPRRGQKVQTVLIPSTLPASILTSMGRHDLCYGSESTDGFQFMTCTILITTPYARGHRSNLDGCIGGEVITISD